MQKGRCILAYGFTMLNCLFGLRPAAQHISTHLYTEKDGLPATYVFSAYQDQYGYLWVGTTNGISRFDGRHFTNYGLADGLPDAGVTGTFMDSRQRLWAITTKGVAVFEGNRFIFYPVVDSQAVKWVYGLIQTKSGELWMLSSVGVYRFENGAWNKVRLYPGYENHACRSVLETAGGLYISYGDKVVLKKPNGNFQDVGPAKTLGYYYGSLTEHEGTIFLWTMDGVCKIENVAIQKSGSLLDGIGFGADYLFDHQKRLWIGKSNAGLFVADSNRGPLKKIFSGPPEFLFQSILEDKEGLIWVGTGNGLLKFSDEPFEIFDANVIIGKKVIRNMIQPPDGPLELNDGSLALQRFQNNRFAAHRLNLKTATTLPNGFIVDAFAFDDKNDAWYALRGFDLVTQQGNNLYKKTGGLPSDIGVLHVLFDWYRKQILAVVDSQSRPYIHDGSRFKPLPLAINLPVQGLIRRWHQCTDGTLLFVTTKGFIYAIDTLDNCRPVLREFDGNSVAIKFLNGPSGELWIRYNGRGLRRYIWQNQKLVFAGSITKADGLANDGVSDACFDSHNNLWVCTNSNVYVFSKSNKAQTPSGYKIIASFPAAELATGDATGSRLLKDNENTIWFFAARYLVRFFPQRLSTGAAPPPHMQIENIELNLQQTDWRPYSDSAKGLFALPTNVTFSHNENSLGINFQGVRVSGKEGIVYSYQLMGFSNQWSTPSPNDFVSFISLPPGDYVFRVRAKLPDTVWSETASFSFRIKKAWWQTLWFYALLALATASVVYSLFRYRLAQKIKLLEVRNRLTQDLHDEIGSSMSGINLLSQVAVEKLQNNRVEEAKDYLLKVKNYTGDVIEKLSDTVWIFNPQNDSLEKLMQRLKSFAHAIASSKDIRFHFSADKESETHNFSFQQRKALYLISKEAVNNAVKYASCQNIFYRINSNGRKHVIQIRDDGCGFVPDEKTTGNGLHNMGSRAKEVNANFFVQSAPGKGTTIRLEL